ncbi:hypothetical protein [Calidifontibacter indicus]|uniref:hypothetical protein n=1 Tax=Calidifontibacter indicus TaxID=419650 RepID=UPI003D72A53F
MSALGAKVRPAQPRRELLARERLARLQRVDCIEQERNSRSRHLPDTWVTPEIKASWI